MMSAVSVGYDRIEGVTADLDRVLHWIRSADVPPIESKVVPGASEEERRALAVLGGLVASIVPARERDAWPPDVQSWLKRGPSAPREVIESALSAIRRKPDEMLASIYAQLVTGENRRLLGTFFTPEIEVELMLSMWGEQGVAPATVVDVGAGVGIFTAAASRRWREAQIFAVDINPVTLGLLALRIWVGRIALHRASSAEPGVRTIRADYTTWIQTFNETEGPRLILGNPPYTRSQLLPRSERSRLVEAAQGLCGNQASLSTLITAISLNYLEKQDGLCLLLPAQWLESRYAIPLRNHLAALGTRQIELRLVDGRSFADAEVDAVILQVGPDLGEPADFVLTNWSREERVHTRVTVDRSELGEGLSWRLLFERSSLNEAAHRNDNAALESQGAALSDFCHVRRGTATGANGFFVISDHEMHDHDLSAWVTPLVRRLAKFAGASIQPDDLKALPSTEKRWLLSGTTQDRVPKNALDVYLSQGESDDVDDGYLCQARRGDWFDLTHEIVIPDVIVGPMTRGEVRFMENKAKAAIVNNLYGWVWKSEVSAKDRTAILEWLRSAEGQQEIDAVSRRQGIGLKKLEPKALAQLRIPSDVATPAATLLLN